MPLQKCGGLRQATFNHLPSINKNHLKHSWLMSARSKNSGLGKLCNKLLQDTAISPNFQKKHHHLAKKNCFWLGIYYIYKACKIVDDNLHPCTNEKRIIDDMESPWKEVPSGGRWCFQDLHCRLNLAMQRYRRSMKIKSVSVDDPKPKIRRGGMHPISPGAEKIEGLKDREAQLVRKKLQAPQSSRLGGSPQSRKS